MCTCTLLRAHFPGNFCSIKRTWKRNGGFGFGRRLSWISSPPPLEECKDPRDHHHGVSRLVWFDMWHAQSIACTHTLWTRNIQHTEFLPIYLWPYRGRQDHSVELYTDRATPEENSCDLEWVWRGYKSICLISCLHHISEWVHTV